MRTAPDSAPAREPAAAHLPYEVVHVGDSIASHAGGISRVIRDHLERRLPGARTVAVTSYDPLAATALRRHLPAVRAGLELLRRIGHRGSETVVHVHLADRGSLVREGGLAMLARLLRHRVVVTWHSKSGLDGASMGTRVALRLVVAAAHRFTVLSAAHARILPSPRKISVVPNDVERRPHPLPMADRRPAVVFAGEVGVRKGADALLRAWSRIDRRGWSLDVFGRVEDGFHSQLTALGQLPTATMHGMVPSATVSSALETASIAVLPSRAEALPMFLLEAMAGGCATIGSTVGGVPELLGGGAGILVDPGDDEALAVALQRLIDSPELRAELQRAALTRIDERYTRAATSDRWSAVYREVLAIGAAGS